MLSVGERAAPQRTPAAASNGARSNVGGPAPLQAPLLPAPQDPSAVFARADAATILPKDALGVTLLVVCAAMALDILAPWSESYTVRQSLVSRFGHPAYVVVALALIAAVPLYRREWRRTPLCAAAPLVVGALAVGVGVTYYIFLARENAQVVSFQLTSSGGFTSSPALQSQPAGSATPISPQLGLYLFMLLGAVMVVVGYQLFLAAVRSQYVLVTLPSPVAYAAVPTPVVGAQPSVPLPQVAAVPAAGVPSPAIPLSPVPMPVPTLVSLPHAAFAVTSPAPAAPPAPLAAPMPGAPPAPVPVAPSEGNGSRPGLVLPGTDAWNQPPVSPVINRQARMRGGWRYSSR